jgi:hypothetical protein
MVNYRGPPKKSIGLEAEELRTKPHTSYTDPVTGDVMIYEVPNQETLKRKLEEKDTATLISEAAKLFQKPKK